MKFRYIVSSRMGKRILLVFLLSSISFFSFFMMGFIWYVSSSSASYDPVTRRIGEQYDDIAVLMGIEAAYKEPTFKVAAEYDDLIIQMRLMLEDMYFKGLPDMMRDHREARVYTHEDISMKSRKSPSREDLIKQRMRLIEKALEYASSKTGISLHLLATMAWVESRMMPYAINVGGKAYIFASKEQAAKMLRRLNTDDADIGLFQINYRLWGKPLGLQKEALLDARVCATIGAMILRYNMERHSNPWEAVGRYHSGTMKRMTEYRDRVSQDLTMIRSLKTAAIAKGVNGIPPAPANPQQPRALGTSPQ